MATQNRFLATLDVNTANRIISIKENGNIDANFVLTHLVHQILQEGGKICMIILHNTLGHYHNIGKRLGYDFLKKIQEGLIETIEPLKDMANDLDNLQSYLTLDNEELLKSFYSKIKSSVDKLKSNTDNERVYLIIDDLSHLLDLGINISLIVSFTNYILSIISDRVSVIISSHVSGKVDEIISNNLSYVADVSIEVSPLKTGISNQVTGLISVQKAGSLNSSKFHYKAYDRGIKMFHLGESVYNLYK